LPIPFRNYNQFMEPLPFVSIITITYQAEPFLRATMDSILNQQALDFEYLLIDGASTDGTTDIIKQYEPLFMEKGLSFRWISEPDKGLYHAMNKGLRMATGTYIWFVNAGDAIASEQTLSEVIAQLKQTFHCLISEEKSLPDFIYGETLIVNEKGEILGARRLKAPETLTWKNFRMGMLVCHQSMLVKRSLAPLFNLNYHYSADFDWAINCLKKSAHIFNTHLVLSHFMEGGVSKTKMKASLKERFQIMSTNYGRFRTIILHGWFLLRAAWFKLIHGWI